MARPDEWKKIGRLKMPVAKAIGVRCADIYVSENHIRHIEEKHKAELEQVGFSAFAYVKAIVSGFNQIRKGSGNSLLLVVFTNTDIHHVAAINLNYNTKKGFWEVLTAQPRRTEEIKKKTKLW